jgi:integrase
MASIREKRPGYWEVRIFVGYDDAGKPVQVSKSVKGGRRDAERLAAQLAGRPQARSGSLTVGGLLDDYLDFKGPTWSLTTRRDYEARAERIKADPIGAEMIARITVAEVDRWHQRLRRDGVGDAQIRNLHTLLRAAFGQALRWELLPTNPVAVARPQRAKKAPRGVMSVPEVGAALAAAASVDSSVHLALRLAAVAGARRAELAALRWDSVADGRVVIDHNITIDRTQPVGAPNRLVVSPTKIGDRRVVALDAATLALIDEVRAESESPWMFGDDDHPPSPDKIGWWWKRVRTDAGLDPKWRLHDLRHWSATHAIAGGHDVRSVAARLGHADPTTTMRTYSHALEGLDGAIAETLAGVLDGKAHR